MIERREVFALLLGANLFVAAISAESAAQAPPVTSKFVTKVPKRQFFFLKSTFVERSKRRARLVSTNAVCVWDKRIES